MTETCATQLDARKLKQTMSVSSCLCVSFRCTCFSLLSDSKGVLSHHQALFRCFLETVTSRHCPRFGMILHIPNHIVDRNRRYFVCACFSLPLAGPYPTTRPRKLETSPVFCRSARFCMPVLKTVKKAPMQVYCPVILTSKLYSTD